MNLKKIKLLGVIIITILSFISHFAYEVCPNIIFSFIFPVNESIWEHMKILFTSTLIYSLIEYILLKKYNIEYNNFSFNTYFIPLMQIPLYLAIYIPLYKLFGENIFISIILIRNSFCYIRCSNANSKCSAYWEPKTWTFNYKWIYNSYK